MTGTGANNRPRTAPDRADPAEPSGERFVPELMDDQLVAAEHHVRYRFAAALAAGKRTLDAGCGLGWGSNLLLQAGARAVTGLDIDQPTVSEATQRYPDVTFVAGDLQDPPFEAGSFELAVCFEAVEHVHDPERAIDELARVLTPGGMLFVSSPNPGVYPSGNPFHVHELRPDELVAAVSRRFAFTAVWYQHPLISSVLTPSGTSEDDNAPARMAILTDLPAATAIYSVVVASNQALPPLPRTAALVSTRQLDEIAATAEALVAERAALAELTGQATARDRSPAPDGLSQQLQQARDDTARHARDAERARAERDEALLRLLEVEQQLAIALAGAPRRHPAG